MVPHRKVIYKPKNDQYDLRPDGSLLCGPGCFSKANVLKKRFLEEKAAISFSIKHRVQDSQEPYACEYCKGFHLTHKETKLKRGKKQ